MKQGAGSLPSGSTGTGREVGGGGWLWAWGKSWSSLGGQACSSEHTQSLMSGSPAFARARVSGERLVSLHPHPADQREDRRQVRAGLSASQVPSQAPRFIFLSLPPTASSFPPVPSPLRLPGRPRPRLAGRQPARAKAPKPI